MGCVPTELQSNLHQWFWSSGTQLPSKFPFPPPDFAMSVDMCREDLQRDVKQRDGPEDGCLVDGRQATRLLVEEVLF